VSVVETCFAVVYERSYGWADYDCICEPGNMYGMKFVSVFLLS